MKEFENSVANAGRQEVNSALDRIGRNHALQFLQQGCVRVGPVRRGNRTGEAVQGVPTSRRSAPCRAARTHDPRAGGRPVDDMADGAIGGFVDVVERAFEQPAIFGTQVTGCHLAQIPR